VFFAVEGRNAKQGALVEQVELAADFKVAALFGRRIGRALGVVVKAQAELVGVARGVVRSAVGGIVRTAVVRLVDDADARAPQAVRALVGERRGRVVRGLEVVVAQAAE